MAPFSTVASRSHGSSALLFDIALAGANAVVELPGRFQETCEQQDTSLGNQKCPSHVTSISPQHHVPDTVLDASTYVSYLGHLFVEEQ